MTQYRITKSTLKGEISVPPSKSHTLRAILFAALAEGGKASSAITFLPTIYLCLSGEKLAA